MLSQYLTRPGVKSSEFAVALITAALNLANSATGWVTWKQALLPTAGAIAYVISRGFAKYEPRNPPA